jgi:hypothetical protein
MLSVIMINAVMPSVMVPSYKQTKVSAPASVQHSSLVGQLVSYEENEKSP